MYLRINSQTVINRSHFGAPLRLPHVHTRMGMLNWERDGKTERAAQTRERARAIRTDCMRRNGWSILEPRAFALALCLVYVESLLK